jgi:adiponectin receptor
MEWLDVIESLKSHEKPIEDIDSFLNYVSKWPLFIHLVSAAICLGFSAIFHLFFVYSPSACLTLSKLDYTGIIILIYGSVVPIIQYNFACGDAASNNS